LKSGKTPTKKQKKNDETRPSIKKKNVNLSVEKFLRLLYLFCLSFPLAPKINSQQKVNKLKYFFVGLSVLATSSDFLSVCQREKESKSNGRAKAPKKRA